MVVHYRVSFCNHRVANSKCKFVKNKQNQVCQKTATHQVREQSPSGLQPSLTRLELRKQTSFITSLSGHYRVKQKGFTSKIWQWKLSKVWVLPLTVSKLWFVASAPLWFPEVDGESQKTWEKYLCEPNSQKFFMGTEYAALKKDL